ncbi:hypothetical protein ACFL0N_01365 [Pseudomonadota bacterium]
MKIAGDLTTKDWEELRPWLKKNPGNWTDQPSGRTNVLDFFNKRMQTRFLDPLFLIQEGKNREGEGFTIVAILCMLIEFLEALRTGYSYYSPKA